MNGNLLSYVVVAVCIITALAWYRAGRKNRKLRVARWALIIIPVLRCGFYVLKFMRICTPETLNIISSALILQTLITLTAWAITVKND